MGKNNLAHGERFHRLPFRLAGQLGTLRLSASSFFTIDHSDNENSFLYILTSTLCDTCIANNQFPWRPGRRKQSVSGRNLETFRPLASPETINYVNALKNRGCSYTPVCRHTYARGREIFAARRNTPVSCAKRNFRLLPATRATFFDPFPPTRP